MKQPTTSLLAHRAMTPELRRQHHSKILNALSGLNQAIAEHIAQKAGMDKVQVSRRLAELEAGQLVVKTGETRPTSSGRQAAVYKLHTDEWFRRYQEGEYEPKPVETGENSQRRQLDMFSNSDNH